MEKNKYKVIYLVSLNVEEKVINEFIQKLENEIISLEGSVGRTEKQKYYLAKTSTNKGARNINMITTFVEMPANKISELKRFLKLADTVILNHLILKEQERSKIGV